MGLSLIEELPKIVAEGKREVERILERISSPHKLTLQTNEFVLPCKDKSGLFKGQIPDFKTKAKKYLVKSCLDLQEYPIVDNKSYRGDTGIFKTDKTTCSRNAFLKEELKFLIERYLIDERGGEIFKNYQESKKEIKEEQLRDCWINRKYMFVA